MSSFQQANQIIHPVEKEFHYERLTKIGFVATTPTGKGFVRSYNYEHPNGSKVTATTGSSADYWSGELPDGSKHGGYWSKFSEFADLVPTFN